MVRVADTSSEGEEVSRVVVSEEKRDGCEVCFCGVYGFSVARWFSSQRVCVCSAMGQRIVIGVRAA